MIVSSRALLNENPSPSEYEVREAIAVTCAVAPVMSILLRPF